MEISHIGHACFKLRGRKTTLIIDPYLPSATGLKIPKLVADAVLCTHGHDDHHNLVAVAGYRVVIEAPGEYEVAGAQILGVPAFHDSSSGSERGRVTLFQIKIEGLTLVHLGDLGHKLDEKETEELNGVDILMIPVGGVYTLNAREASLVVSQLAPKIVIPMHYKVAGLKYNLEPVERFLKEMGKEGIKPEPKLIMTKDRLPEDLQVIILE